MVCEKLNVNVVSSRVRYFSDPLKSYPSELPKSFPVNYLLKFVWKFPKKWCDFTKPCRSLKFNRHHLREKSTGLAVLTENSEWLDCSLNSFSKESFTHAQKQPLAITLKVHECRFENLPICSNLCKNDILKVFYS